MQLLTIKLAGKTLNVTQKNEENAIFKTFEYWISKFIKFTFKEINIGKCVHSNKIRIQIFPSKTNKAARKE